MKAFLLKLKEQVLKVYQGMSARMRWLALTAIVGTVGLLGYLTLADHTKYATLYSGLARDDAAAITAALKKAKASYQLRAGGTAVAVPQEQVHELRLALASQGLPKGSGVGFEIFDKQAFGLSDFAQQINYRRALQGELERTISQVAAVQSARVHLAMPRRQVFARKQKSVSASVTLKLMRGRVLSAQAVQSVLHLVSSAVSGLSPDRVTIMDTRGRMLWGGKKSAPDSTATLDERQNRLENTLERRVAEILDKALGEGRSVVKVTVEMASTSLVQTEEVYDPDQTAVRSEKQLEEKGTKGRAVAQVTSGVAGTGGNLPGGKTRGTRGGPTTTQQKKQTLRNYEVSKTIRKRSQPAGELKRLSVAVLIDKAVLGGKAATDGKASKGDKQDKKGEEALAAAPVIDIAALEVVVKQAVGYSVKRGDMVSVRAVPFVAARAKQTAPKGYIMRVIRDRPWLPAAAGGGVLLIAGVLVFILLRRRKKAAQKREPQLLETPMTVRELEGAEEIPLKARTRVVPQELSEQEETRARELAEAAAEHDARRAAQVLRAWMVEG
jgi:flagellar M-ring protein FliF